MKLQRRIYNARLVAASLSHVKAILPFPPAPQSASLKLTENCNARCVMCDYWHERKEDRLSTARVISLLDELYEAGIRSLTFSGGEPLLRRDLFEILAAPAVSRMSKVHLSTNGLLLARHAEEINRSSLSRLTVSLDGVGEHNDEIRGVPGYYDKVVRALQGIRKPVHVRSLFTKVLARDIEELLALCARQEWNLELALPDSEPYCFQSERSTNNLQSLWPDGEEVEKVVGAMTRAGRMDPVIEANTRSYMSSRKFLFQHCFQGYNALYISSTGDLRSGCLVFDPVGNVLEQPLADILRSGQYRKSLREMFDLRCDLCTCGYGYSSKVDHAGRRLLGRGPAARR